VDKLLGNQIIWALLEQKISEHILKKGDSEDSSVDSSYSPMDHR